MNTYWPRYRKKVYITITAAQCAIIAAILYALQVAGVAHFSILTFAVAVVAGSLMLNIATLSLIHILGTPFRDLINAIILTAGEPTISAPPNPNKYEFSRDGFKQIIQTVYNMASSDDTSNTPSQSTTILENSLNDTPTGIVLLDKHQAVVYHNQSAPIRQNTDNQPVLDLLFPEFDTLTDWLDNKVKNKFTDVRTWTRVSDKLPGEKDRRIFDIAASYHKNSSVETILTLFDRTNEYMPEEDDLDFVSFAAHELRGPITVIRGYLDVIDDELGPKLEADQSELIKRLIVASNRLTSYINNILNASRYDRRHFKLHLAEESLHVIYTNIADDMQLRASAQNRTLVTDIPDTLPTVAADTNAIGEVLGNLIDNAIKYSNEGSIVNVSARPIPGFIEVTVKDRGIGMPSNVIQNLFNKFYRSHRSRETVAGTGIGLYICRAIVSSHGGIISAQSVENEGSIFTFTIPIYDTVADKISSSRNNNSALIEKGGGWIKNHSMRRG